jgi:predicted naringenin-chalcone synthase
MPAYINRISTAVPPHDVHRKFIDYASGRIGDTRKLALFKRMAGRAQIAHRYSFLEPLEVADRIDRQGLYDATGHAGTAARMALYEQHAPQLALAAVEGLHLGDDERPTHIIVTSCTGFMAPGLDLYLLHALGLPGSTERTLVGFMGCYAAINGLKLAHHIVRSDPAARVLMVNVELCTLHLQPTDDVEALLSFLIFADGAAASLITARPAGVEIAGFTAGIVPETADQITWQIGDQGFDMYLSGAVPATVGRGLEPVIAALREKTGIAEFTHWVVHPGGRSVLDAAQQAMTLRPEALAASRRVLEAYGNMSSPTVMFALADVMAEALPGQTGVAMAFGPGVTAEMVGFRAVS